MQKATRQILLVDDDPLILTTLGHGLEHAGYRILAADNVDDAIAMARQHLVDLVILDMRLEGKSGLDAARWLRAQTQVPFMFLSAYGDDEVVQAGVDEGALGYLVKPVEVCQLVPAIEAALKRASEIRGLREQSDQLRAALHGDRGVSMAVGIVMERNRLTEKEAFDLLRNRARSQRRKLAQLAAELIQAQETLNQTKATH